MSTVYAIKSLNLTEKGLALLAQYPAEALQYADAVLLRSTDKEEPFGYLVGIARKYCQERGLSTNYELTVRLMKAYQIDPSMDSTIDKKINREVKASTGKTGSSSHPVGYDLADVKQRIQQNNINQIEALRETDPAKYARIKGSIETMKNVLGIDDEGRVLDESNPPTVHKFLSGLSYISSGDLNPSTFKPSSSQETSTPPTPLAELPIVQWWRGIYKSKGRLSPMLQQINKQVTDSPAPEVIRALELIKETWPQEWPNANENRF